MHNCKTTRTNLIELALDELQPALKRQLLADLKDCVGCQEEYASLRNVLRVSDQALRSTLPEEGFWPGYHQRLSRHIEKRSEQYSSSALPMKSSLLSLLRKLASGSVRIPIPVAAGLILVLGISFFFSMRSLGQMNTKLSSPSAQVQTRTVEVPVVQEKVITRVVYVEKNRRRARNAASLPNGAETPNAPAGVAKSAAAVPGATAISLVGFKPTDQVKLKIMKGSYHDEK